MLLHGLIQAPYFLQVAHGWWRIILRTNLLLLVGVVPLNLLMARAYGAPGTALVWVLLNVCYLVVLPTAHRRFLNEGRGRWLFEDILPPLAGALCAGAGARWLMPPGLSRAGVLAYLCAAGALAALAAAALAPRMRAVVLEMFRRAEPSVARIN
jgi:hypothetical protein